MVLRYFGQLFRLYTWWIFVVFDVIGIITMLTGETLIIPSWGFWIIASVSFLIANIQLFNEMERRINEYEIQEANIVMHVLNSKVRVKAPVLVSDRTRVQDARSADGLDDRGMPIVTNLFVELEIENTGVEYGDLLWKLDLDEIELPELFMLFKNNINGTFRDNPDKTFLRLDGRDRTTEYWRIGLSIQAEDPESFAKGLLNLSDYRLFLKYQTKRIGATTDVRTALIEGDFSDYRDSIIKKWQARKMGSLINLARGIRLTKIG